MTLMILQNIHPCERGLDKLETAQTFLPCMKKAQAQSISNVNNTSTCIESTCLELMFESILVFHDMNVLG